MFNLTVPSCYIMLCVPHTSICNSLHIELNGHKNILHEERRRSESIILIKDHSLCIWCMNSTSEPYKYHIHMMFPNFHKHIPNVRQVLHLGYSSRTIPTHILLYIFWFLHFWSFSHELMWARVNKDIRSCVTISQVSELIWDTGRKIHTLCIQYELWMRVRQIEMLKYSSWCVLRQVHRTKNTE